MSKKKAGGKTSQHKRPNPKSLGIKISDGEHVNTGQILVRQRGSEFKAGKGVSRGRDFTLYSTVGGFIKIGNRLGKKVISVLEK